VRDQGKARPCCGLVWSFCRPIWHGKLSKTVPKLRCGVPATCAEQRFRGACGGHQVLGIVRDCFGSVCQGFVRGKTPLGSFILRKWLIMSGAPSKS